MITNGYLLTPQRIEHLNRAGLDHLQISIDNVQPDEVSKKSLKVLDRKLQMLARYAIFQVNINSVLGSPVRHPEDALAVARRALELGFTSTVGILHDHDGQLQPLGEHQQELFAQIMQMGKRSYARFNQFQKNISHGMANDWRCRAGSRYLYICEDGLVHYCSQQRGFPAIPLEKYTPRAPCPRVPHPENLRAALHRFLRAASRHARQLALAPNPPRLCPRRKPAPVPEPAQRGLTTGRVLMAHCQAARLTPRSLRRRIAGGERVF